MSRVVTCMLLSGICLIVGCGSDGPPLHPTTGVVNQENSPLPGAELRFFPIEGTEGVGGTAKSDETGSFEVMYSRGGKGLPVGKYRVVVSKRVMPDGSEPPADVEPMDSPAKETLPPKYSDEMNSELRAEITADGAPVQIDLE